MSTKTHPDNQYLLHDAIHGAIDLQILNPGDTENLLKLINSIAIQRLRNIKQLGFAYLTFQSADHSRYSHAIGTMYIAHKIFNKVKPALKKSGVFKEVREIFKVEEQDVLKFVLLTALLQDIGELPFSQATDGIFKPNSSLINEICENKLGSTIRFKDKQIFTLAIIYKHPSTHAIISSLIGDDKLSWEFLTYLLVDTYNDRLRACKKSKSLRSILDGVVDADRLDYVYRDAHHTFGNNDKPDSIISSLITYDDGSPIFNDSGPISDFFLKRWHLWNNVYFAPENRFNSILLKEYLKYTNKLSLGDVQDIRALSLDDFLRIDDFILMNYLKESNKVLSQITNTKAKIALENLLLHKKPYEWFWIVNSDKARPSNFSLPEEVFYDTFSNYKSHKLFNPGSVRIESKQYKNLSDKVFLEDCSGVIGSLIKSGWETLPQRECFLIFEPLTQSRVGNDWENYNRSISDSTIYDVILCLEDKIPNPLPEDTWELHKENSTKLFISYAVDDSAALDKVILALYRLKVPYRVVRDKYNGSGNTKKRNCLEKMSGATNILVLGSKSYLEKTKDSDTGVSIEFDNMKENKDKFRISVLGIEPDYSAITDRTWEHLVVGKDPISHDIMKASAKEMKNIIEECLKNNG